MSCYGRKMSRANKQAEMIEGGGEFKPLRMVLIILMLLIAISAAAQWYGRNVTMPRYCEDPVGVMQRVHQVLTEKTPAGGGDRKPYIIAARLTFLHPRESNEALRAYLIRLRGFIEMTCQ